MRTFKDATLQTLNPKIFRLLSIHKINMRQEKKDSRSAQPSRFTDRKNEIPPVFQIHVSRRVITRNVNVTYLYIHIPPREARHAVPAFIFAHFSQILLILRTHN